MCDRLVWSQETPTVEGQYWIEGGNGARWTAAVRIMSDGRVVVGNWGIRIDEYYRWAGPIPEPEAPDA